MHQPPAADAPLDAGSSRRRLLLAGGRALVTLAIVAYVYRRLDWPSLGEALQRTDLLKLGAAVILQGAGIGLMTLRWHTLLAEHEIHLRSLRTWRLVLIGLFANLFYLGSIGGDMARFAGVLADARERKARLALSVMQDRLIGLGALLVLLSILVVLHRSVLATEPAAHILLVAIPAAGLAYLLGLFLLAWWQGRRGADTVVETRSVAARTVALCRMLVPRRFILPLLALSLAIHALSMAAGWVAARAVGLHLGVSEAGVVMGITALSLSLPITVAGLGVREGVLVWLLAVFGFTSGTLAIGLSSALLGINLFWAGVGAAAFFWPSRKAGP